MPFRPKTARDIQWEKWMAANQGAMLDAGIPITVAEDKKALLYFLEHGYYSPIGSAEPLIDSTTCRKRLRYGCASFSKSPTSFIRNLTPFEDFGLCSAAPS
jgi:hypothetical protein